MREKPRLFLIDGHSLAYRTYFALTGAGGPGRWMTRAGEPTAGTYGFTSVLLRLLEQEAPDFLAVSFDTGRTFRDDLYPEYKATRDKSPDDLAPQVQRIRQVVSAFGIPILEADGFEADDVLGTIARRAADEGVHTIILTGDRDLLQLTDGNTTIRLAGQKLSDSVDYGPAEVEARFGIPPQRFVDYKALVGDTSDNIPGVKGIGEKTALELLRSYDSLAGIYAHLEDVPNRFRSKLMEGRPSADLSQRLSAIVTDVPLEFDLEACRVGPLQRDKVIEIFRELEFRSLIDRLPGETVAAPGRQLPMFAAAGVRPMASLVQTTVITSSEELDGLVRRLKDAGRYALDVETTSTDPMRADLVGIALAISGDHGFYLPVGHDPSFAASPQLDPSAAIESLRGVLTDPSLAVVGHNLKYDVIVLERLGVRLTPVSFDTMIAEWLCDPASRNLGLKNLAFVRLGLDMVDIEELIGRGRNQRVMGDVPVAEVAPYAAANAAVCLQLESILRQEMEAKNQIRLFGKLEMPLLPVLADMEMAGILLDTAFLRSLSVEFGRRLAEIEARIEQAVGHPFNVNSPQQLSKVLFEELGLPRERVRKTSSGHHSTAAAILEDLRNAHPVVDLILEQREISKLQSTYVEALPQQVNPATGRLHTSYNQTGSVTGRLASSEPNLQNIPIRTDLGRKIRRAFQAAPGTQLLSADYSQIELRIAAHMAQDEAMLRAFQEGQDIHRTTAAAIYGVPPEAVTPEMRRHAKAVNFGLLYGMSPYGLSRSTGQTLGEAEEFVKTYFERFPGIRGYLDRIRAEVRERGYVETLSGRRRYFPQLVRGSAAVSEAARARAEREAINAPIQGTAADIIKFAMLRLPADLSAAGLSARMLLQVHDELVFECPIDEVQACAQRVQEIMRTAFPLSVPLQTDAKVGPNWAEMQPVV
ncbi:MAG: DNA polymerase I [Anaerolineales bacterium]